MKLNIDTSALLQSLTTLSEAVDLANKDYEKLRLEAQGYKADAERYRCLAQHVDFGDWFCGYGVVKDSYGGTEDFYMDDKKHMDETIDKVMKD